MKLDVGCGPSPRGDVNLDLFTGDSPHVKGSIVGRNYPNFIIGDAENLPLRSNIFQVVYAFHLIEHLENPIKAMREFERVGNDMVYIKVPSNPIHQEYSEHLYSWSLASLTHLLRRIFPSVKVFYSWRDDILGKDKGRVFNFLSRHVITKPLLKLYMVMMRVELSAICQIDSSASIPTLHADLPHTTPTILGTPQEIQIR